MATFQNSVSPAPPPASQQSAASLPSLSPQQAALPSASQQPVAAPLSPPQPPAAAPPKSSPPPVTTLPKPNFGLHVEVFEKHSAHWYPQGDILLQVGRTRFKVHRDMLDAVSTWFHRAIHRIDCLNLACSHIQAAGAERPAPVVLVKLANVDGVPLLYIDAAQTTAVPSAQEFALLLDFLYRGIQPNYSPVTFEQVLCLYKVATYYCFPHIVAFVKKHLEGVFPSDFSSLEKQLDRPEVALGIGAKYGINAVRRRAYYDLARAPATKWRLIASTPVSVVIPALGDGFYSVQSTTVTLQADPLSHADDRLISALRMHLTMAWSKIPVEIQSVTCPASECGCLPKNKNILVQRAAAVVSEHPCDPLCGVRLLAIDKDIIRVTCYGAQASIKELMENTEAFIVRALEREWISLN